MSYLADCHQSRVAAAHELLARGRCFDDRAIGELIYFLWEESDREWTGNLPGVATLVNTPTCTTSVLRTPIALEEIGTTPDELIDLFATATARQICSEAEERVDSNSPGSVIRIFDKLREHGIPTHYTGRTVRELRALERAANVGNLRSWLNMLRERPRYGAEPSVIKEFAKASGLSLTAIGTSASELNQLAHERRVRELREMFEREHDGWTKANLDEFEQRRQAVKVSWQELGSTLTRETKEASARDTERLLRQVTSAISSLSVHSRQKYRSIKDLFHPVPFETAVAVLGLSRADVREIGELLRQHNQKVAEKYGAQSYYQYRG